MPELPEVEAWRRSLDERLRGARIASAGPAHIATLKTFDPPLTSLEGLTIAGVERRGKRFLIPLEGEDLVVLVHLMSAGRLKLVAPGGKRPGQPAFRLGLEDGGELVLTEAGRKKRAGVWLLTREGVEAEHAHLGPEADTIGEVELAAILRAESRRLHSFLRDQRALAGIGRAWANEILHTARLSPYALSGELSAEEVTRLHEAIQSELARGLALREKGAPDPKVYRVHKRLGEPCHVCGTPLAQVDFEEHTIFYCPECQTGGRVLKDRRMSRLLR